MKSRDSRLREHMLAVGSQFEGLLAEVTITLDDVDADDLGGAIEGTLCEIATFFHADGAFLFDAGAREADGYAGASEDDEEADRPAAAGVWGWDASGARGGMPRARRVRWGTRRSGGPP
ncbi:hypothetical protein K8I85_02815 [bacterium]|nr:hypothetical protein [bacterium]